MSTASKTRTDAPDGLDTGAIRAAVATALAPGVAMPSRVSIDAGCRSLLQHLEDLMGEDYDVGRRPEARALYTAASDVLDKAHRPTAESSQFSAWQYTRNLAALVGAFLDLYTAQQAAQHVRPTHSGGQR
ncbi:DUF6415 family natural product biosynthesis protein [Streptomyces sp. NBC_01445]|uniref:DUF6415 family natural product biosynthesis protein n=1 Tax=Streptomyces sp. NBC_01445 TaxID=2903869 RepID=UPI002DD9FA34|nr:DUF6415 family natural product biosynthesis protein [Streptomyces sp. NBC_01445]WSE03796.1 DUF6415 family natural product biosynthesis protein [Streptomyces sp. NBC_01445]